MTAFEICLLVVLYMSLCVVSLGVGCLATIVKHFLDDKKNNSDKE
jgi:hypothetical protein